VFAIEALLSYSQLSAPKLAAPLVLIGAGQASLMIPLLGAILAESLPIWPVRASGVRPPPNRSASALGAAVLGTVLFPTSPTQLPGPLVGVWHRVLLGRRGATRDHDRVC